MKYIASQGKSNEHIDSQFYKIIGLQHLSSFKRSHVRHGLSIYVYAIGNHHLRFNLLRMSDTLFVLS